MERITYRGLPPQTEAEIAAIRQRESIGRKNTAEGAGAPEFEIRTPEKVNPIIVINKLTGKPYGVEEE